MSFTWMSHPDLPTSPPAQIPDGAVEAWGHMGWVPCEAPPVVDLTQSHHTDEPPSETAPETAEPPATGKPAKKPTPKTLSNDDTEEDTRD